MRLIEALNIINGAHADDPARPRDPAFLACGFTPLHLQTFLAAHLQQRGARGAAVDVGNFGDLAGNVERAAARPAPTPTAVVVEWADLDPRLGLRSAGGWGPALLPDILDAARAALRRIEGAVSALAGRAPVALCPPTLALPPIAYTPGAQASAFELALRAAVAEFAARLAAHPRVRVLGAQRLDLISPPGTRADPKSDLAAGFPYKQAHAEVVARLLAELLRPAAPKKGLVTDLDDTLWRGILGEVGVGGVSWSLDQRTQVHALYQQFLGALAGAGVLVAVASKNDPHLVDEAFGRADLLVRRDQLFPVHAHWRQKSESLRGILASWNVAADSVVFVDDSPMELAEVKSQHPGVECLLFPKDDPAAVLELLARLRDLFGKPALQEEDAIRLASLRDAAAATEALAGAGDGAEQFLAGAEASVTLDLRKDAGDTRALELLNKTNQFNLNGRRYTEAEWLEHLARDDSFVVTVGYRDRFGPLGKIAVVAGRAGGGTVTVDSWVMSCRAFARRIEHQTLRALYDLHGASAAVLDFRPTERNGPLQEFLGELAGPEPAAGPLRLERERFEARCPALHHTVETLDSPQATNA